MSSVKWGSRLSDQTGPYRENYSLNYAPVARGRDVTSMVEGWFAEGAAALVLTAVPRFRWHRGEVEVGVRGNRVRVPLGEFVAARLPPGRSFVRFASMKTFRTECLVSVEPGEVVGLCFRSGWIGPEDGHIAKRLTMCRPAGGSAFSLDPWVARIAELRGARVSAP